MNRRSFIRGVAASFFVLPSATTYARNWIAERNPFVPQEKFITSVVTDTSTGLSFIHYVILKSYEPDRWC